MDGELTITYEDGTQVVLPELPTGLLKAAGDGWVDYFVDLYDPLKEHDGPLEVGV